MEKLEVRHVSKAFDGRSVLEDVSLTLREGELVCLLGVSGGGKSTLYGHCSELLVSEGQTVSRGQAIAKVGSTGWSTGPHLHFEVREDEQHVNPLPYLKGN